MVGFVLGDFGFGVSVCFVNFEAVVLQATTKREALGWKRPIH